MCVGVKLNLIHGVGNLTTLKMCEFLSARKRIKLTGDGQVGGFHPSLLHQVPDGLELRHNLILLFPSHRLHTEDKGKPQPFIGKVPIYLLHIHNIHLKIFLHLLIYYLRIGQVYSTFFINRCIQVFIINIKQTPLYKQGVVLTQPETRSRANWPLTS